MDVKDLAARLKMRNTHNVDAIQVPLNEDHSPRFILTTNIRAIDGVELENGDCKIFIEYTNGDSEVLWTGPMIGDLEHMASAFASMVGITKGRVLRS